MSHIENSLPAFEINVVVLVNNYHTVMNKRHNILI